MQLTIMRRRSAILPVAMSVAALAVIGARIAVAGIAPEPDEGAAAHLWELLMVAQMPVIGYFALTTVPGEGRTGLVILATQLLAALVASAPVFILRW
jgi:hypothetical protein